LLKTFDILLDIEKELYDLTNLLFSVSMNDNDTIQLNFKILQDEKAMNLTDSAVELAVKTPSGKTVFQVAEVTDAENGLATIRLSEQAFFEFGTHKAEVYIRQNERLAVTSPFWYSSREAILHASELEEWSAFHEALLEYDKKPILVEGIPTAIPEYIGQIAFDVTNNRVFIAYDLTAESWQMIGAGEGGTGVVGWNDIIGRPTEFTPEAHTHIIDEIEGLQAALDAAEGGTGIVSWLDIENKPETFPAEAHNHSWGEITEKPTEFTPEAHSHDWAEIENKPETFPAEAHSHDWASIENKPLEFAPEDHTHDINEVEGLQAALDGKADAGETGAPEDHTHEIEEINGLQAALNDKANAADVYTKADVYNKEEIDQMTWNEEGSNIIVENNLSSTSTSNALAANQGRILNEKIEGKANVEHNHDNDYAPINHSHAITDIEELQTTLDGKADTEHNHSWGEITEKPTEFTPEAHNHSWGEITEKPLEFTPEAHSHEIIEINGLEGALNGKANAEDLDGKADAVHNHVWADITDKPTEFTPEAHSHDWGEIVNKPTEFTPEAHNHSWGEITEKPTEFTPNLASGGTRGGIIVGNGLRMAGEYLTLRTGEGIAVNDTASTVEVAESMRNDVQAAKDALNGLSFWRGTQEEYDAIETKNPDTVYFVV
jgi:hypothetical protein